MAHPQTVIAEPEVERWLLSLPTDDSGVAARAIDRLAEAGHMVRMPHSRSLGEGLFELRFHLRDEARRITYWFAPERRIVLLTTFGKQRDNERHEVQRARRTLRDCQTNHHHQTEGF